MKKFISILYCMIACTMFVYGQNTFDVVFEPLLRNTAQKYPVRDHGNDKRLCALVVVSAPGIELSQKNFVGDTVKTVIHKEKYEYWVYIPEGCTWFEIKGEYKTPDNLISTYFPNGLQSGVTYKLDLSKPKPPSERKNREIELLNKNNWSLGVSEKFISKDLPFNLSIHGAYVTTYVPIEFEATLGLKKSAGTYIYDSNGTIKDSYEYRGFRFTARSGYCFEIGKSKRFMITPMGGFSYNILSGCQIKSAGSLQVYAGENKSNAGTYSEAKKSGNGGNALSFAGGVRLSYAVHENWLLQVTPEYNVNIWKDDNFNYISKSDDGVKAWAEGFNISVGLIFRWER